MDMSNKSDNLEMAHEGWLTKSPPTKRIWRARWRKRWFVLRHSGELPGQYFLCYYTDRNCRKLKGQIDLDQCEQVDAGLRFENRKQKYQFMFDVKTPKRIYYLAAESEEEMNKWVDCICQVCGLKAYSQEDTTYDYEYTGGDDEPSIAEESSQTAESPPVSPTSTASGPYIPIFECISGKPLNSADGLNHFQALQQKQNKATNDDFYDAPRRLQPPDLELRGSGSTTPPLQSPATDVESVFTDEEWTNPHPRPTVNWETFPRPSDSSLEGDVPKAGTVSVGKRYTKNLGDLEIPVAPPRPPKPSHLVINEAAKHEYLNLDNVSNEEVTNDNGVNDEMYDFPRSHQLNGENDTVNDKSVVPPVPQARHCYSNAAPGQVNGDVFRYDFAIQLSGQGEPNLSPAPSDSSSSVVLYSNLPSPAISLTTPSAGSQPSPTGTIPSPAAPPVVNRGLKPGRKLSDTPSAEASPAALPNHVPPNINRKLKPSTIKRIDLHDEGMVGSPLKLSAPPLGKFGIVADQGSQSLRRPRAAPSPTPPTPRRHSDTSDSDFRIDSHEQVYYYESHRRHLGSFGGSKRFDEIHYLDLDLDSSEACSAHPTTPPTPMPMTPSPTVYKTVDFLKTEAFNRTRQLVEEERKQCTDVM
uniref:PH domain-containing protein n=1 Tax=Clastoptera arizonana TaxID=38151 RepID=A0A1B6D503_9HEMI